MDLKREMQIHAFAANPVQDPIYSDVTLVAAPGMPKQSDP